MREKEESTPRTRGRWKGEKRGAEKDPLPSDPVPVSPHHSLQGRHPPPCSPVRAPPFSTAQVSPPFRAPGKQDLGLAQPVDLSTVSWEPLHSHSPILGPVLSPGTFCTVSSEQTSLPVTHHHQEPSLPCCPPGTSKGPDMLSLQQLFPAKVAQLAPGLSCAAHFPILKKKPKTRILFLFSPGASAPNWSMTGDSPCSEPSPGASSRAWG